MKSKKQNPFYIENAQTFRQTLLSLLNKLTDHATQKKASEELRDLFLNQVQDIERMTLVISCLSESNEHQKSTTKKELVKVLAIMAEIYEDKLLELLPKMFQLISKRVKEGDPQLNVPAAETTGAIVRYCLKGLSVDQACKYLRSTLKTFFAIFSKNLKQAQIGAAMCITKIIQTSQVEPLVCIIDDVMQKLIEITKLPPCSAHLQILEATLSLVLAMEDNLDKLQQNSKTLLPVVVEHMINPDWNVRKISIEIIYTIAVLAPEVLAPHRSDLIEILNNLRFDKIKNVRDIAITTLNAVKESGGPESELKNNILVGDTNDGVAQEFEEIEETKITRTTVPNEERKYGQKNKSPYKRFQVNEDFFRNAAKDGEIEIKVKSPLKGSNYEKHTHIAGEQAVDSVHLAFLKASPKIEKGERADPTYNNDNFFRGDGVKEALHFQNINDDDDENRRRKTRSSPTKQVLGDIPAGIPSGQNRNRSPPKNESFDRKQVDFTEERQERHSKKPEPEAHHYDMSEIYYQLSQINNQQSKIIESINDFQSNTNNELNQLRNRVTSIEEFVDKFQKEVQSRIQSFGPYGFNDPSQQFRGPYVNHDPRIQIVPQGQTLIYGQAPSFGAEKYPASQQRAEGYQNQQSTNASIHPNSKFPTASKMAGQGYDNSGGDQRRLAWGKNRDSPFLNSDLKRSDQDNRYRQDEIPQTLEPTILENQVNENSNNNQKYGLRQTEELGEQNLWDRISNFIRDNFLNDAYETCLLEGDEIMLMKLINKTGMVVNQLDLPIVENLLGKIRGLLNNPRYFPTLILWIERSFELELPLPKPLVEILNNTLRNISERNQREHFIDPSVEGILEKCLQMIKKKKLQSVSAIEEASGYPDAGDYHFINVDEPHFRAGY